MGSVLYICEPQKERRNSCHISLDYYFGNLINSLLAQIGLFFPLRDDLFLGLVAACGRLGTLCRALSFDTVVSDVDQALHD